MVDGRPVSMGPRPSFLAFQPTQGTYRIGLEASVWSRGGLEATHQHWAVGAQSLESAGALSVPKQKSIEID